MLQDDENYNVELYQKSDLPPVVRETTIEQALVIAQNQVSDCLTLAYLIFNF